MHGVGYCHLDLSLENLLVRAAIPVLAFLLSSLADLALRQITETDDLKICDFGVARECRPGERFDGIRRNKPGKIGYSEFRSVRTCFLPRCLLSLMLRFVFCSGSRGVFWCRVRWARGRSLVLRSTT